MQTSHFPHCTFQGPPKCEAKGKGIGIKITNKWINEYGRLESSNRRKLSMMHIDESEQVEGHGKPASQVWRKLWKHPRHFCEAWNNRKKNPKRNMLHLIFLTQPKLLLLRRSADRLIYLHFYSFKRKLPHRISLRNLREQSLCGTENKVLYVRCCVPHTRCSFARLEVFFINTGNKNHCLNLASRFTEKNIFSWPWCSRNKYICWARISDISPNLSVAEDDKKYRSNPRTLFK